MTRWLVLLLVLCDPRPSEACQCVRRDPLVVPALGATDVPLDAHIFYRGRNDLTLTLYRGVEVVPLQEDTRQTAVSTTYELTPRRPLAPATTYELLDGDTLVTRFTTGATTGAPAPAAPRIDDLRVREITVRAPGMCNRNPARLVDMRFSPDPSAVAHSVRWSTDRFGGDHWLLADDLAKLAHAREHDCWFMDLLVDAGERRCFEVAARGANGLSSEYTRHCVEPLRCAGGEYPHDLECAADPPRAPAQNSWRERVALYGLGLVGLAGLTWLLRRRSR